jgi:hypothetical protein
MFVTGLVTYTHYTYLTAVSTCTWQVRERRILAEQKHPNSLPSLIGCCRNVEKKAGIAIESIMRSLGRNILLFQSEFPPVGLNQIFTFTVIVSSLIRVVDMFQAS